jgi:hypothetical protein
MKKGRKDGGGVFHEIMVFLHLEGKKEGRKGGRKEGQKEGRKDGRKDGINEERG